MDSEVFVEWLLLGSSAAPTAVRRLSDVHVRVYLPDNDEDDDDDAMMMYVAYSCLMMSGVCLM